LAGAALFALPSEHENFGIAALEALAAGTPALVSPQVDLAAPLLTGDFGHVVPAEARLWAMRLAALLVAPLRLADAGERARRLVCAQYSWYRIHEELLRRYRWVLSGCPADAAATGRPSRAAETVSS
jgi:glycosyltransferase involved in cell wall biosynthesis